MSKPTISLCMIVKNEERCIDRCLNSVADKVDEIIIVDTGSTDNTLEIVGKYNAKVFHYEWNDHFANARNFALDQAASDYVLHLDADEWVEDPEEELQKTLDKEIYYIPIRNDLGGGLAEVHKFPRLFRRIDELRYEGAIHEQINLTLNWHRPSETLNRVIIHHDGYLHHIMSSKGKEKRNLSILLRENTLNPSAFNHYNLGQQYFTQKDYNQAIKHYKKSFEYGGEYTFTKRLLIGLVQSLTEMKQYKEALAIVRDASQLYPDYVEYSYYEGLLYQQLGYFPDAATCFETCILKGDSDRTIHFNTYEGTGSYLAYARLAEVAIESFEFTKANEYLKKAINQAPGVMGLFKSYLDLNNTLSPVELYKNVEELWPQNVDTLLQLVAALYKLRHPLLIEFMNHFTVQTDAGVRAFIQLLEENYSEAKQYWESKEDIQDEEFRDILLLSVLIKDSSLIERFNHKVSLRQNEKKVLVALAERKKIESGKFTKDFEQAIFILVSDIVKLQKYELLDHFIGQFTTPQMRYILAKVLYDYGFYETVLEVLLQGDGQEENYNNSILAARSLRHLNMLEDSLYYYNEAYKIKPEPMTLFHICDLAVRLNDSKQLMAALEKMMRWDIESPWVKKKLNY